MRGVVQFWTDEDVEFVPDFFEGALIGVKKIGVNGDGETLEAPHEGAVQGGGGVSEFGAQGFAAFAPGDKDGDLRGFNQAEGIGNGFVLKEEGLIAFLLQQTCAENAFSVPSRFLPVVIEVKIVLDAVEVERVSGGIKDLVGDAGGLGKILLGRGVFGAEDMDLTGTGQASVPIAASGGLGDGIESGHGAIHDGEIDIDAGFNELGGDDTDCFSLIEALFDFVEDAAAVFGAHQGGEVEMGIGTAEEGIERLCVFAGVHDAQHLRQGEEFRRQGCVIEMGSVVNLDPFEFFVEFSGIGNDLAHGFESDGEIVLFVDGGRCGGAEDDGAMVVGNEFTQDPQAGGEVIDSVFSRAI